MDLKNYIRPGNGASDIMPLLANAESFHYTIEKLSELSQINQPSKIMGIEGRGFILGSAVAFNLGIGFVPVRSFGKLKNSTFKTTYIDYSNNEKIMEIHQDAINAGENVVIIDDWVETGGTIKATVNLVAQCGGQVIGIAVLMDDSSNELKAELEKYNYKFLYQIEPDDEI